MSLLLSGDGYEVEVSEHPFALRVRRGEQVLVEPGAAPRPEWAPFAVRRAGEWQPLQKIVARKITENGADLTVRSETSTEAQVSLKMHGPVLTVAWTVRNNPSGQILQQTLSLKPAGHWYGFGHYEPMLWPLERGEIVLEPCAASNTRSPIWLTSAGLGLFVPTREVMRLSFNESGSGLISWGVVDTAESRFHLIIARDLAEARGTLIQLVGKPRRRPSRESLAQPIFSTWTQFGKTITQEQVLHFARDIRRHDFPCHVVQVDERWETNYGDLVFDRSKFPDPKAMVEEIHALGFLATLWVSPFVNDNSVTFSQEYSSGYLVPDRTGKRPALLRWWNGCAGLVDLSNPQAVRKYAAKMQALKDDFDFDGFKFDGGDARYQPTGPDRNFHLHTTPSEYCDLYQQFMHDYFYHLAESRTAWLAQGFGNLAREGGKDSVWGLNNGLAAMIVLGLYQGLLGYPYLIPDMIGGRIRTRDADTPLPTARMFLRWVQASALMPVMQYSWAPWNCDRNTMDIAREYTRLHEDLADYLDALADQAVAEGQPMIRPLFLEWPRDEETFAIYDQYLLGRDLLAAPVISPDSRRKVYLPEGQWVDPWTGAETRGPRWLEEREVPVHVLPLWVNTERSGLVQTVAGRLAQVPTFAGGGRTG